MKDNHSNLSKFLPLLIIIVIIFLLYSPLFFGVLNQKDSVTFTYPYFHILKDHISDHTLPLWSKYLNYPVHAESQGGFFYPLHLVITYLLPFWFSHNLNIIIHLIAGAVFTYLLLNRYNLSPTSSSLGALAFVLSSHFSLHTGILPFVEAGAYIAVFLYIARCIEENPNYKKTIILGLAVGTSLLLGHFQFQIYGILIAFSYLLIFTPIKFYKRILYLLVITITGLSVSAIQLIPTAELAILSKLSSTPGISSSYSFNPLNLITSVFPALFGESIHTPSLLTGSKSLFSINREFVEYWGWGAYFENILFVGIPTLILAFYSTFKSNCKHITFFSWSVIISLFLSLGKINPVSILIHKLPPLSFTRIPSRFIFITIFSLAVLSSFGFERLNAKKHLKTVITIAIIVMLISVLTIILTHHLIEIYSGNIKSFLMMRYGDVSGGPDELSTSGYEEKITDILNRARDTLSISNPLHIIEIVVFIATIITLILIQKYDFRRTFKYILLFILIIDLSLFFYGRNKHTEVKSLTTNPITDIVENDTSPTRIYSSGWDLKDPRHYHSLLAPNTNAFLQLSQITPRCSLLTRNNQHLEKILWDAIYENGRGDYPLRRYKVDEKIKDLTILKRLGISYIIRRERLSSPDIELTGLTDGVYIYRIKDTLSLIYATKNISIVDDWQSSQSKLQVPIEDENSPLTYIDGKPHLKIDTKQRDEFSYEISSVQHHNNKIGFEYDGDEGIIVVNEMHYPGWNTYIDGDRTETLRAFGFLRAFKITGGKHSIVMKYEPSSFKVGAIITLISSLLIITAIIITHRKKL